MLRDSALVFIGSPSTLSRLLPAHDLLGQTELGMPFTSTPPAIW